MQAEQLDIRIQAFERSFHIIAGGENCHLDKIEQFAMGELARLENKYNPLRPGSLCHTLNENSGSGIYFPLDQESTSLLQFCDALWAKTNHLFDPSIQIVFGAIRSDDTRSRRNQHSLLPLVGWNNLERSESGVRLKQKGMYLDMNQCLRPYAIERLRKKFLQYSVDFALIDCGQDFATIGKRGDGSNWLIGMKYPLKGRATIKRLKLNNRALSMRGDFESARNINGELFGRAFSPVDGEPIPGLLSVAVAADSPLEACSAATVARFKTETAAITWLKTTGLSWLAIDRTLACLGPLAE